MKRGVSIVLVLLFSMIVSSNLAGASPDARGFGFGGAMGMVFFPDMTGINAFLSENDLPSMGSVLGGVGGNGRGGVIGDLVFGGVGWGLMAFSENDQLQADLISAGGGFDIGAAIGGDRDSVLTVGIVLGGGANILTLSNTFSPDSDEYDDAVNICGIIPEPTVRELVRVQGFVQPYVSMAAQFLPGMGFEFRIGYIFPLIGMDIDDLGGIPAPSLELSGPSVSFGLVFGGIGSSEAERAARRSENTGEEVPALSNDSVTLASEGSFSVPTGRELVIENGSGELTITSYVADTTDTTGDSLVQWQALRTAKAKRIDDLQTIVEDIETGILLRSVGLGNIDYTVQIPVGIDLRVKNATGYVSVVGHEAQTIIIENGVGGINLQSVDAAALIVSGGVCEIVMADTAAQTLLVNLALGWISIDLPADTSARLLAKTALGNVSLVHFPGMTGGAHGFISKRADATLGLGRDMIELNVGLGDITISTP